MEMRTVLLADNDEIALRSINRCLRIEPFFELFANNSKETLDISQKERVQIIVNDIHSFDMEGEGFLRIACKRK